MKFVNRLLAAALIASLAACATKQTVPSAEVEVTIKETEQYLPRQTYDEFGKPVKYTPTENPYLAMKGKVDKGSVLLFIEAKRAFKKSQFKKAKQKLKVITGNDESLSGPWVLLGKIANQEKDFKGAEAYFNKALEVNQKNLNAYAELALLQRKQGRFKVAQNTLETALKVWPDFPEAHLNLGILYDIYLNQPVKAQQHLEAYVFLNNGKNLDAKNWYKEVMSRTGIQTSFIDLGPTEKEQEAIEKKKTELASNEVTGG